MKLGNDAPSGDHPFSRRRLDVGADRRHQSLEARRAPGRSPVGGDGLVHRRRQDVLGDIAARGVGTVAQRPQGQFRVVVDQALEVVDKLAAAGQVEQHQAPCGTGHGR